MSVCVSVYARVFVFLFERERERESLCVCVRDCVSWEEGKKEYVQPTCLKFNYR